MTVGDSEKCEEGRKSHEKQAKVMTMNDRVSLTEH
jgi:hypothetical protein